MTKWRLFYVLAMIIVIVGAAAIAGDNNKKTSETAMSDLGPMGAPPEMKMLAGLAGEWDVEMSWKMDPASEDWMGSRGKAVFMSVLDGCGMHQTYKETDPETDFQGSGMMAYNRETGKWQSIWMDNMTAAISYYQGDFKDGALVVSGEDYWNGMKYISRITTKNITENKFDWIFEMSLDEGQTFTTMGKCIYTRAK